MATPNVRPTGLPGKMAYSCTYHCPAPGCGRAAVGYDSQRDAKFIGRCPVGHMSVCDTRR
jgi:hypothetical protein